ncbi:MAG TPA: VanZ family protein [Flavobacterium sp.]|jgi:VanZ family protein|nr:VanZ family protein [Flavobacterium sp.]
MNIKHLLAHKYFFLIIAEAWTVFIAFMCLVEFNKLPSLSIKGADKYVHFSFYFVFTILWFLYFNKKREIKNIYLKLFFSALIFGSIIEIAQEMFTSLRHADIYDVLANVTGTIFAIVMILFYKVIMKKRII